VCECPSPRFKESSEPVALATGQNISVTGCIVDMCVSDLSRCEADDVCALLFPQGLRALGDSILLQELWSCVDRHCPLETSKARSRWIESACMQNNCFAAIAACETNRECAATETDPLRDAITECEQQFCVTESPTPLPSTSPTTTPTPLPGRSLANTPGLHFVSESQNLTKREYREFYPAFQMNSIPINPDKIVGRVRAVDNLCDKNPFLPSTHSPTSTPTAGPTTFPTTSDYCADAKGYDCSIVSGRDCSDFSEFGGLGYSMESWEIMVASCSFSCGVCAGAL
jgi:hypothetical protein